MAKTHVPPDFQEFLKLLNAKGVEYLLVGGYAVIYYGHYRATADIDLWVRAHPRNATRIVEALREFGFGVEELSEAPFLKPDQIVRMGRRPLLIELMTTIDGVQFDTCFARRVTAELDEGLRVPIISLDDLKQNKAASGRPKDLGDLDYLRNL